jgi:hypothetical protein
VLHVALHTCGATITGKSYTGIPSERCNELLTVERFRLTPTEHRYNKSVHEVDHFFGNYERPTSHNQLYSEVLDFDHDIAETDAVITPVLSYINLMRSTLQSRQKQRLSSRIKAQIRGVR